MHGLQQAAKAAAHIATTATKVASQGATELSNLVMGPSNEGLGLLRFPKGALAKEGQAIAFGGMAAIATGGAPAIAAKAASHAVQNGVRQAQQEHKTT